MAQKRGNCYGWQTENGRETDEFEAKLDEVPGLSTEETGSALPGAKEDLEELEAAVADAKNRLDEGLGFVEAVHARLRTLEEGEIRGG